MPLRKASACIEEDVESMTTELPTGTHTHTRTRGRTQTQALYTDQDIRSMCDDVYIGGRMEARTVREKGRGQGGEEQMYSRTED